MLPCRNMYSSASQYVESTRHLNSANKVDVSKSHVFILVITPIGGPMKQANTHFANRPVADRFHFEHGPMQLFGRYPVSAKCCIQIAHWNSQKSHTNRTQNGFPHTENPWGLTLSLPGSRSFINDSVFLCVRSPEWIFINHNLQIVHRGQWKISNSFARNIPAKRMCHSKAPPTFCVRTMERQTCFSWSEKLRRTHALTENSLIGLVIW